MSEEFTIDTKELGSYEDPELGRIALVQDVKRRQRRRGESDRGDSVYVWAISDSGGGVSVGTMAAARALRGNAEARRSIGLKLFLMRQKGVQ